MLNYLRFYSPAIISPPEAVLIFGQMEFCNFFFQINYGLRYCLPQQMPEVDRRIFIYLQLTYDWLPVFHNQSLQCW